MSNLTAVERTAFINPLPLQIGYPAMIKTGVEKTGLVKLKPRMVSVKAVTEVKTNEGDAIKFTFSVSHFVKADSRVKNSDGKYAKDSVETWQPAKVFRFSPSFELVVENYTESIFCESGGYFTEGNTVSTRAELADLAISYWASGSVSYIVRNNGKVRSVYDPTVSILWELLKYAIPTQSVQHKDGKFTIESVKYQPIEAVNIYASFIDAYESVTKQIALPSDTLLASLNSFAERNLNTVETVVSESASIVDSK